VAAGATPAFADARHRVRHVRPGGSVQAAVDAVDGSGRTIVVHPGTYREAVNIPADKGDLMLRGATRDPRDAVIVHDNANGTKKPDGTTYGTAGSATVCNARQSDGSLPVTTFLATFLTTGSTTIGATTD
jgi:pectinesterase